MPALANRLSLAATVGAGRTRKTAAAAATTATSVDARRAAEIRPPPLADVHIKMQAGEAEAHPRQHVEPEVEVDGLCAAQPPSSPPEAASENIRSRRDGTWKECTTRTEMSRTISGSSTFAMPATGPLTAWKNHTDAAIAPAATRSFIHPGGRDRVA